MGFFTDHGVEYRIVLRTGKILIVLTTIEIDARLVKSNYFNDRKDTWFDSEFCENKISIDIDLTHEETDKIQKILDREDWVDYGFFEVVMNII